MERRAIALVPSENLPNNRRLMHFKMLVKFRWIVERNRLQTYSRPTKQDKSSEELIAADQRIEKFREVLDRIGRKFLINPSSSGSANGGNGDQHDIDKRCKKVHEYKLAQAMEESLGYLGDGMLRDVLMNCGKWDLLWNDESRSRRSIL